MPPKLNYQPLRSYCGLDAVERSRSNDEEIIRVAEKQFLRGRQLEVVRLLDDLQDQNKLTSQLKGILAKAENMKKVIQNLKSEPSSKWIKQGEIHGKWDTIIYSHADESSNLTARIETLIQPELLSPMLCVLNETSLYETWIPSWKHPFNLGIRECKLLRQTVAQVSELVNVIVDVPWPFASREVVLDALAIDDVDVNGSMAVLIGTGDPQDPDLPPLAEDITRMEYTGGFLFRKCPSDHPLLGRSKDKKEPVSSEKNMILVCSKVFLDPKVNFLPKPLQDFITKTVIGSLWEMFLQVAQDVRDGKRPQHAALIEKKLKLYEGIEKRIQTMLLSTNDSN